MEGNNTQMLSVQVPPGSYVLYFSGWLSMSFGNLVYIEHHKPTTTQLAKWMLDKRRTLLFPKDMGNQPEK